MKAYIHSHSIGLSGEKHCFYTTSVDVKINELWWQKQGLQFTSSGYGSRIPTVYMVKFNGKWRRVYCRIYSNSGTLYIGNPADNLMVQINEWEN